MATMQSIRLKRFRPGRRLFALVCLSLVVASVASWWFRSRPPRLPILATFNLPVGENWPLAFSPDGKTLATWGQGGVCLLDLSSNRIRARATLPTWAYPAVFSPDGSILAAHLISSVTGKAAVIDPTDGTVRTTLAMTHPRLGGQRFSADGTHFSIVSYAAPNPNLPGHVSACVLQTWRTSDWIEEPYRSFARVPDDPFILGPDGKTVASNRRGTSTLSLWSLADESSTGTALPDPAPPSSGFRELFFSPDGRTLAASGRDGGLDLWDVGAGSKTLSILAVKSGFEFWSVVFTPDRNTVITSETETLASRGPPGRIDNVLRHALRGWNGPGYQGRAPYVAVRDLPSGRLRALLDENFRPVVSADGSVLATADVDGRLTLWDLSRSPTHAPRPTSP